MVYFTLSTHNNNYTHTLHLNYTQYNNNTNWAEIEGEKR
jgi:hypothetical protein